MQNFLAIDAGGTSTRAVFFDASGWCLGYGTAGGGNPVSRGFQPALAALMTASTEALRGVAQPITKVLVAMAGASLEIPAQMFQEHFATLGLDGEVLIESDLLAAFYSGTYQASGSALIAGTGAVGARICGNSLVAVADGTGWLLGDEGSGFWLGRQVARAVAAALDGRGQPTALTELVLADLGIVFDQSQRTQGRLRAQQQLISKVYESSAIELSRFAPFVFAVGEDAVATDIVERAADALTRTLLAVSPGAAEPLVFGGSVLTKGGTVATAVAARLGSSTTPILVHDGVVGAAVLVLKRHGIEVGTEVFGRIHESLAQLRS